MSVQPEFDPQHQCHICDAPAHVPCDECGEFHCGVCEADGGVCVFCDETDGGNGRAR